MPKKFPHVIIKSHGLKTAKKGDDYLVPRADIYLDCRSIKEPGVGGDSPIAQTAIDTSDPTQIDYFLYQVVRTINAYIPTRRGGDDPFKHPIEVLCLCAHGKNRSVAMKYLLNRFLRVDQPDWEIEVEK
jgi:hypothetical protein